MAVAAAPRYFTGHGDRVKAFAEKFIVQTKGKWAGKPLVLEPWQIALLDELFLVDENGDFVYREALIGLPRKNGKSTLMAAIALYGLLGMGEPGAEVYVAAASKDQARIVFNQSREFVEASPRLLDWLKTQKGVITLEATNSVFRVLSSDAPLQHGLNPSMVVIDELHAHRDPELYYALTTGQLARDNPLVCTITTAGYDKETILGEVYDHGERLAEEGIDAMRRERFLHLWFQGPDDCDLDDEEAWMQANPSSWITKDRLRRERTRLPEHVFRRLHLNQWTLSEEHWLPPGAWGKCGVEGLKIPRHAPVTLGVDLGLKHDCAAVVVVHRTGKFKSEKPITLTEPWIKYPPQDGTPIDIAEVEAKIRDIAAEYDVQHVVYDPWRFQRSAEMLEGEGLPMVEWPPSNERMAPASERLYEAITSETIQHPKDPDFTRHVESGITIDTERGWRLTKKNAKMKVDALMALAYAYGGAMTLPAPKKINVSDYRVHAV